MAAAQAAPGNEAAATAIEGDWLVASRDAIIRIQAQGDSFIGTIVWQLHDTYGPEDGPELNGRIVTDRHNPDPALRSRPLTGLRLLWGLHYDAAAKAWVDGFVYNSDNGKQYHCEVHVPSPDTLVLRGYIGIPLLGGSTTWTRTHEPFPARSSSVRSTN
ncbi:DUF2147 domain-containing protein [Dyella telluris]|uniref:DUF2147 domain-containing protein n=1 Tax=Dyella telluris TaxID=2763498 RepID=A0A7G8Q328_9GAMM|nr:DUF2147 domain-containing protein [Dyella telluris]QNK01186.1 DUF2147 domain-containing protein [Dyella telluris]